LVEQVEREFFETERPGSLPKRLGRRIHGPGSFVGQAVVFATNDRALRADGGVVRRVL
jgi:hypothetical protein